MFREKERSGGLFPGFRIFLLVFAVCLTLQVNGYAYDFGDDFSVDSTADYSVTHTWTTGGVGSLLHDSDGERLQLLTGDNIALEFSRAVPALTAGSFSIDFSPTAKYPKWGLLILRLLQDDLNYYEICNSDGDGPCNGITKVVNGKIVETVSFTGGYSQGGDYPIAVNFRADQIEVDAFGELLILNNDTSTITVNSFSIESAQQDGFFDNVLYGNDGGNNNAAPTVSVTAPASGGIYTEGALIFFSGTASDMEDGDLSTDLSWSSDLDGFIGAGIAFSSSLLTVGTHRITASVTDNGGLSTSAVIILTVVSSAPGDALFSDDFSIDSTTDYTIYDTWTKGGTGTFLYDAGGERVQLLTGDNIALAFSRTVPSLTSGSFNVDILPVTKYPLWGLFAIRLMQDEANYYEICNGDGSGPCNGITKVVNGEIVDTRSFTNGYSQNTQYHIAIRFSPDLTEVEAFGEVLILENDTSSITVNSFYMESAQQDIYIDTLLYSNTGSSSNTAPTVVAAAPATGSIYSEGDSITFLATATDIEDGDIAADLFWISDLDGPIGSGASFSTSLLTAGTHRITTSVTDSGGLSGAAAITVIVNAVAGNTAPSVTITAPVAGSTYTEGDSVTFIGTASDVEDGDIAADLLWSSDLDGSIGSGASFSTAQLTPGTHRISTSVTDGGGISDSTTITLTVLSPTASVVSDSFTTDTTSDYLITDTWTKGGTGSFFHDVGGERAQLLTGDNVALAFSQALPPLTSGSFSIDVLPVTKYPLWGLFIIRLMQDEANYYEVCNADGPGPCSGITKVVDGEVVEFLNFAYGYSQNINYQIAIDFGPDQTRVDAFGEVLVLNNNTSTITVNSFSVEFAQQDGYIDNIDYSSNDSYVLLIEPGENSLQEQSGLTVKAVTSVLQDGWGVKFVLDSAVQVVDSSPPFEALFTDLTPAEYTVEGFVVDDVGHQVVGASTHDIIRNVGIGKYYVGMGDSITAGVDDDLPSDNISSDGRNSGGGYTPVLNDFLTIFKGFPYTVVNEGIPGDQSVDGLARISEVLARHPGASRFLIQYGTNDASLSMPVLSGLGLTPGDSGYPGSFKDNMQQIINAVNGAGKEACLAKIPIVLGSINDGEQYPDPPNGLKNIKIREFNAVIDELVADPLNNIAVVPPDFYGWFSYYDEVTGHFRYEDEYKTNFHPGGTGYISMADLWFQALTE